MKGKLIRSGSIFLFCAFFISSSAQVEDSVKQYLHRRPGLSGDLGSVQTFFYGFKAPISYADIGLSYAGRVRFGIGCARLKVPKFDGNLADDQRPFYRNKYFTNESGITDTVNEKLHFEYLTVFGEYVFFHSKHWEFSVPLRLGFGDSWYRYNYAGQDVNSQRHFAFVYRPSVSFDYRICRWIGFNTEVGYIFTLSSQRGLGRSFSSPVVNLGFFIYYSEMYKPLIKKWKEKKS
jgi:hypothetical protein